MEAFALACYKGKVASIRVDLKGLVLARVIVEVGLAEDDEFIFLSNAVEGRHYSLVVAYTKMNSYYLLVVKHGGGLHVVRLSNGADITQV
jgi:hypothetical protein